MNAICLILDRLHAGYVGAYGNAWVETPSIDRLASRAFVLDQAMVDSPDLERLYQSYWQGWPAACNRPAPTSRPTLAATLCNAGVSTALLCDDPTVARLPAAADFQHRVEIELPGPSGPAEEIEGTHFGRCFVEIIRWLSTAREPFCLWCHLGGLGTTWDAPTTFRQAYREPGDPTPPTGADVPNYRLAPDADPDALLGVSQAYAGQVTLLDACLGVLLDFLDDAPFGDETLLALTSARGFPLGEHGRVGACDDPLYGELVHVPCMLRLPGKVDTSGRSQSLVEPADLWAALLDAFGVSDAPPAPTAQSLLRLVRGETDALHDRICLTGRDGLRAIRTPAWHLLAGEPPELFVKPEDRWEVNNVANLCPEVVERLGDAIARCEQILPDGRIPDLPPLDELLLHGPG